MDKNIIFIAPKILLQTICANKSACDASRQIILLSHYIIVNKLLKGKINTILSFTTRSSSPNLP